VSFVTSQNNLYTQSVAVTFSSPCIAQGLANVTTPVTTTTGIATTTYSAQGCSGTDVITATADINSATVTATGTVTVAPATVGSIQFISATPQKIGLQGTGGVGLPETSTVVFKVVDSTGGPVANSGVDFALNTTVGGITFTPQSGTSGADGLVQTVVKAGTVATSVRVTATVTATSIASQSSQLIITTGLPTQNAFSAAVTCQNIEAFDYDGVTDEVTVRLADRFQNPVPDGTAITFTASGGHVIGGCTTQTTPTESGVCTVDWTSSDPRPANGRVIILGTAIGEESFTDVNSNGFFDDGDTWSDIGEPFRDDNENGVYDAGEFFLDFDKDGLRTVPDGKFEGLLCGGPGGTLDTQGRCASRPTTSIGRNIEITMSGSGAVVTDNVGGVLDVSGQATKSVTFTIGDIRGNPMPAGTTITASASNGSVVGPNPFTVLCTGANTPLTYTFSVKGDSTPSSGLLFLAVKTPKGVETDYQIVIND
jgi:hypothetical protein